LQDKKYLQDSLEFDDPLTMNSVHACSRNNDQQTQLEVVVMHGLSPARAQIQTNKYKILAVSRQQERNLGFTFGKLSSVMPIGKSRKCENHRLLNYIRPEKDFSLAVAKLPLT
jgi:hypothetical protein